MCYTHAISTRVSVKRSPHNSLDKVVRDIHVVLDALSQGQYENGLHVTNSQMI